jgi:hypothetical protein
MAESILNMFDANGSPLAVPVSPADGVTPDSVSIQGNSLLHNQYSNIGDPNLTEPAYNNIGEQLQVTHYLQHHKQVKQQTHTKEKQIGIKIMLQKIDHFK